MKYFITLTYKGSDHSLEQVLHDVKMMIKKERRLGHDPKYIYVMEYQKRGSIHVHMITNSEFTMNTNKNGYKELTNWIHGFSSVLHVDGADDNFKPHLYLFKYMKKAQRIGKSFLHSSRNLNNYYTIPSGELDYTQWSVTTQERSQIVIHNSLALTHYRYYLKYDKVLDNTLNKREFYG